MIVRPLFYCLNDALKRLKRGLRAFKKTILDTLKYILEMVYLEVIKDKVFLFLENKPSELDKSWIQRFVDMFNDLLEMKEFIKDSKYWPIAVFLLAFICTFHSLRRVWTYSPPDIFDVDQKQKLMECLEYLHDILDGILQNLSDEAMHKFNANLKVLRVYLEVDFIPFLEQLDTKLKKSIQKSKKVEGLKIGAKIGASSVVSIISFVVAFNFVGPTRFIGAATCGTSAAYTAHKCYDIYRLINEYNHVQKNVNGLNEFLKEICDRAEMIYQDDPDDQRSEFLIIRQQFKAFRDETRKFQKEIFSQ